MISGVNIKTINNQSILGSGNITIQGGGGTGGTSYNAGTGITISSDTISISDSTWGIINNKYDKTGGTVSGSVIALEEVSSYGTGGTGLLISSVVDNLNSNSTTDALSANQGRVLNNKFSTKQDTLVSGVNIKTINGSAITGSGNLYIPTGGGGGGSDYYAGANISIDNYVISVTGITGSSLPSLTAGTAINATKLDNHPSDYFVNTATTQTISGVKTFNENIIGMKDISAYGSGGTQSQVQVVVDSITASTTAITAISATDALSYRLGVVLNNKITGLTSTKQDKLVSGTNIKTINGQSLLGAGNITIEGGGGGGTTYYAGANINIVGNVISVTGITANSLTSLTAGTANYADRVGTSSAYYTKTSLDTAFNSKLGTGDTAANSSKWGGYKIVVGSIGSATDTIYFGT